MKDKDCTLCNLAGEDRRSVNVTVNPATLCYRHQPTLTPDPRPAAPEAQEQEA